MWRELLALLSDVYLEETEDSQTMEPCQWRMVGGSPEEQDISLVVLPGSESGFFVGFLLDWW